MKSDDNAQESLCYKKFCLFLFNCDLVISEDCNEKTYSYSSLGMSYEIPSCCKNGMKGASTYLANEVLFKVKELEVFRLK